MTCSSGLPRPGEGATFEVVLPICLGEMREKSPDHGEAPLPRGRECILLVDDEPAIVSIARRHLNRLGYEVVARTSSIEALAAFQASPNRFDALVTDQTMPNMTGAQLARKIMDIRPDIPVILCTGYSETLDREQAIQLGIREYVMKPIIAQDLSKAIRRAIDQESDPS